MNNKKAINTYLSTTESKKQTKQTRRMETELWKHRTFRWLPDGRWVWENGCIHEGMKKYKLIVTE